TGFPVIPGSSLKGVLLQAAREKWGDPRSSEIPDEAKLLFGTADKIEENGETKQVANAGCVQIMEAKVLAFPVRSLAGCFAWVTCPTVLQRFERDTGRSLELGQLIGLAKDHVAAGAELRSGNEVVLEEY